MAKPRILSDQDLETLGAHLDGQPVPILVTPQGIEDVKAMAKELLALRQIQRASDKIMNVFPNKIVEAMFVAYCKARGMNPNDWPTIGLEKQNAWLAAATAAIDELR